ncbi:glycosyltransferase family 2 protein [Dermacoccus nishinomiyaensis]|uniref:glycosyltransferase family 2 protein n=1 Tax=Dermacoccus nishinomiyaensis TaxID=1274 RepID=UPI000E1BCE92
MIETQPTEPGPDLSVIICVLNGAHVIRQQLDALRAQRSRIRWEVIVADNGSTDDTRDVVEGIARNFPVPLRVIDASAKKGAGAARNSGAQESRARFLAFCDCDDQVAEGWVQAAHDGLLAHDVVAGLNREMREPFDPDAPILNPECVVRGSFGNAVMSGNARSAAMSSSRPGASTQPCLHTASRTSSFPSGWPCGWEPMWQRHRTCSCTSAPPATSMCYSARSIRRRAAKYSCGTATRSSTNACTGSLDLSREL